MLIQGIGDEVVSVLFILFLVLLISILWLSTHVQERPPVRAVVIRSANSAETIAEFQANPSPQTNPPINEIQDAIDATAESIEQINQSEEVTEIREANAEVATDDSNSTLDTESDSTLATIKIRFINEDSLEIRERLTEKLGQFITKHLDRHLNLTNEDRVRLIYNGRVLGRDQTLEELGLTDNCVVHCLVQRSVQGNANESGPTSNNDNQPHHHHRLADDTMDLDLSSFCLPLLGALLMGIWWCQVVYSQYFNLTTTISLVSLTILFLATAVNSYLT